MEEKCVNGGKEGTRGLLNLSRRWEGEGKEGGGEATNISSKAYVNPVGGGKV